MNNVTEEKLLTLFQQLNEGIHKGNHISEVKWNEHNCPIIEFSVERFNEFTKMNSIPLVARINQLLIYQVSQKKIHQRFFTNHLFSQFQKLQLEKIKYPIVPKQGCILMNPIFCEQWPFFLKYIQNGTKLDIDFHDLDLTQILKTVQKVLESQLNQTINIYLSPCFANFIIVKELNQIPFFFDKEHFLCFIQQNTLILNQRFDYLEYWKDLSGQLSFEPFQIQSTEIIDREAHFVDLQLKGQYLREFDNDLIKRQLESHKINEDFVQIKPRQYYFIHSLLCKPKNSKDFHKHIIIFSEQYKPKCQYCGIIISVQDYNTLFYDIQFVNQYESFIQMVMSDLQLFQPVVFYLPIFFRIIKENENMFIEYYTLKNPSHVEETQRIYLLYKLNYNHFHEDAFMQNQYQNFNTYSITHQFFYEEGQQKLLQDIKDSGGAMQNDIIEEFENDQQQ